MTLSALIKKGGLAERMAATVATQETDQLVTVATVAIAKQLEPLPELSPEMDGVEEKRTPISVLNIYQVNN